MKVFLVGVGCVGKTTIGGILAQRLGYPFFDLDVEIERHFGQSIERLRERFGYEHTFWQETAPILSQLGRGHEDVVVALVPSGLRDAYLRALKKLIPRVVVAIEDEPDNILARITFFDIDSKPMKTSLTKPEKRLYTERDQEGHHVLQAVLPEGRPSGRYRRTRRGEQCREDRAGAARAICDLTMKTERSPAPMMFLTGPPGADKSTLVRRVCNRLGLRFLDLSGPPPESREVDTAGGSSIPPSPAVPQTL